MTEQPICAGHPGRQPRVRWRMRDDGLEESVQFVPGYNCDATGWHSHGVHGMELWWYLRGPAGAAYFQLGTDWIPGQIRPGHGLSPEGTCSCVHLSLLTGDFEQYWPSGIHLGYHARAPQCDDQPIARDDCPVIGGPCYTDGSYSAGDQLARPFVVGGEDIIWTALQSMYDGLKLPASDAGTQPTQRRQHRPPRPRRP